MKAEESEKIINETSFKIVKDNNLKLSMAPQIDIKNYKDGEDLKYLAKMELFPKVQPVKIEDIKFTHYKVKASEEEIQATIDRILDANKDQKDTQEGYLAKLGDIVNIDYIGKLEEEDEPFEGGSGQGFQLDLGSKTFIDNFEDQLVGKKAGETVEVKVTFPKEYHQPNLANKKVNFTVKINKVSTAIKSQLTDEFVKDKLKIDNITKLKELITKDLENTYAQFVRNAIKKEIFDCLNDTADFEIPESMLKIQTDKLLGALEQDIKANPDNYKTPEDKKKAEDENKKIAKRMVKIGFILSQISSDNDIKVENQELFDTIQSRCANMPEDQRNKIFDYYRQNQGAVDDLRGSVLEDKVVTLILEKGNGQDKEISSKDAEKLNQDL